MKLVHWLLLAVVASCLTMTGCGLIQSDERDVEVQQQNLSAKLHKAEWDAIPGFFAADAVYIPGPGKPPIKKNAGQAFANTIKPIPSRGNVVTDIKRVTDMGKGVMVAAVNINISISDPMRQSTLDWNAAVSWKKINGSWKIIEMKEISERARNSGY